VAADGSGNVYIADYTNSRVVKVSNGTGTVLGMGTLSPVLSGISDVSVDAPGNVYIAGSGNNRIVEVSAGTTKAIAMGTGSYTLSDPNCAAVGNVEDLFICDSGNSRIVSVNQELPVPLSFAAPNITQAISLLNLGNAALTFAVPNTRKNPSFGTASFTLPNAGSTGYCPQLFTTSATSSVTAGNNCVLNVKFSPSGGASGTLTDTPTITDNNLRVAASPLLWGLLLLPFAGRMRKTSRRLGQRITLFLLLAVGLAISIGIGGCGGNDGFFAHPTQTYTITETVTVGSLSRSATITLTVE